LGGGRLGGDCSAGEALGGAGASTDTAGG